MLDQPRLTVTLTPKEATYGLKEWPVSCDARTVGLVRRERGIGSLFSGVRHRLSQQLVDGDGTVRCVVDRSAALKGDAATYTIQSSDGEPRGWISRRNVTAHDGVQQTFRELRRAVTKRELDGTDRTERDDGELIGSLGALPDEPETTYGFFGAGDEWATVRLRRVSGRGGWEEANVWTLRGMSELTAEDRLLAVAVALVAEPWNAGERVAARRSQNQSEALA